MTHLLTRTYTLELLRIWALPESATGRQARAIALRNAYVRAIGALS